MIGFFFGFVGLIWGFFAARMRGVNRLDWLQYGAGFAIAFGLSGILLEIALWRYFGLR